MDFLQTILDNPNTLMNIPTKKGIDPLTHDFDSESISDRLFSLLSVMDNITHEDLLNEEIRTILQKYDLEIKFLKGLNKPKYNDTGSIRLLTSDEAQILYYKMLSKLRERKLSQII